MATHSSIPAWRIPMDRGVWWPTVHGVIESDVIKCSMALKMMLRVLMPSAHYKTYFK